MEICPCSDVDNTHTQNICPASLKGFLDNCMYINIMFWKAWRSVEISWAAQIVVACVFQLKTHHHLGCNMDAGCFLSQPLWCLLILDAASFSSSMGGPAKKQAVIESRRQWRKVPQHRSHFFARLSLLLELSLISLWEVLFLYGYLDQYQLSNSVLSDLNWFMLLQWHPK